MTQACATMQNSYEQAQENIKGLVEENRNLVSSFDDERLRLEKMHLEEVQRLHKAVKVIKKRAN